MSDKRPGRPPMDPFARRMEIFQAVAPIILHEGVAALTMRRAAEAAHLSRSGLYHWFNSKRQLVLYPMLPGICEEAMQRFQTRFAHLLPEHPKQFLHAMIETSARTALQLRPALHAALELGARDTWDHVQTTMTNDISGFIELARQTSPHAHQQDPDQLARHYLRQTFGALLDRRTNAEELTEALRLLIFGNASTPADSGSTSLRDTPARDGHPKLAV